MNKHTNRFRLATGALAAALLLGGCQGSINPEATLVDVDGGKGKITLGYGNFFAHFTQAQYDAYYLTQAEDINYWTQKPDGEDKSMQDSVKEDVMNDLKSLYVSQAHADEYDVKIDDEQKKKIDEAVDKFFKDNSEETIKKMGATKEYVTQYLEEMLKQSLLQDAMEKKKKKELKPEEYNQAGISIVRYFVGGVADENGEAKQFTSEELKEFAEKTAASDDMEATVKETGFDLDPDNYTISGDVKENAEEMGVPEEVAKAARELKEGEISDVIESDYEDKENYYVVRKDKDLDKEYSKVKKRSLSETFYTDTFEEWTDKLDWKVDEGQWKKVKFTTSFEAPEKEEEEDAAGEAVESEGAEISVEPAEGAEEAAGAAAEAVEAETEEDASELTEGEAEENASEPAEAETEEDASEPAEGETEEGASESAEGDTEEAAEAPAEEEAAEEAGDAEGSESGAEENTEDTAE